MIATALLRHARRAGEAVVDARRPSPLADTGLEADLVPGSARGTQRRLGAAVVWSTSIRALLLEGA